MASRWIHLDDSEIELIKNNLDIEESREKNLYNKFARVQKTISISSRKGKGRNLQKFVAERISSLIGIPFDNTDDSCLIHSREMGQSGVDVILRGEAKKKFPFAIECKSVESINLRSFIAQAKTNIKEGDDWMVVLRTKSIPETIVVISWDTFEELFKKGFTA